MSHGCVARPRALSPSRRHLRVCLTFPSVFLLPPSQLHSPSVPDGRLPIVQETSSRAIANPSRADPLPVRSPALSFGRGCAPLWPFRLGQSNTTPLSQPTSSPDDAHDEDAGSLPPRGQMRDG